MQLYCSIVKKNKFEWFDALNFVGYNLLIRNSFWLSNETFLTASEFQYENFLKTFLAQIFEFLGFAHAH